MHVTYGKQQNSFQEYKISKKLNKEQPLEENNDKVKRLNVRIYTKKQQ
jgi:hypothetical protein